MTPEQIKECRDRLKGLKEDYKGLKCPKCGYEQYCPCESCVDRLPKGKKPWIDIRGDAAKCSNCGYTLHLDGWLDVEWKSVKHYEVLSIAIQALDELEKKEAEIVRLKNRVDALLQGHAGDKGSVQLMGMRVKQLEAELERVRGYKNEIIDGIANSTLESREGGKE